jgi:hypothetical protein
MTEKTLIAPEQVQVDAPKYVTGFLCRAWGETDLPEAALVRTREEIIAFIIAAQFGDTPLTDLHEENQQIIKEQIAEMDLDVSSCDALWQIEFEIGGISVEHVTFLADRNRRAVGGGLQVQPDSTEQLLDLYAAQAEAIRALLDERAPHTTGNLQTRIAAALPAAVEAALPSLAQRERDAARKARPPSDDEPWVVADDTGVRLTFRTEDAAWRYRDENTNRLVNPTVTHELATVPQPRQEARPLGCALAMRVLQSDLYKQLNDAERADCDELVQRNLEWLKRDGSSSNAGVPDAAKCGSECDVLCQQPDGFGWCAKRRTDGVASGSIVGDGGQQ